PFDKPINANVGKIAGGDCASSVLVWCTFDMRTGLYPGEAARDGATQTEDLIRQAAAAHPFLSNNPPTVAFNGFMA
ncbi:MAG: acetylornithine deacetylase, partial [Saprospiraceae bacterium]